MKKMKHEASIIDLDLLRQEVGEFAGRCVGWITSQVDGLSA
jgi:hypothetical protein